MLLRQRRSALHYFQLLPAIAASENDAGTKPLRERTGTSARCDGISSGRLCSDSRARAFAGQRSAGGQSLDVAAQIETRRGTEFALTKTRLHGAVAIAVCGAA